MPRYSTLWPKSRPCLDTLGPQCLLFGHMDPKGKAYLFHAAVGSRPHKWAFYVVLLTTSPTPRPSGPAGLYPSSKPSTWRFMGSYNNK